MRSRRGGPVWAVFAAFAVAYLWLLIVPAVAGQDRPFPPYIYSAVGVSGGDLIGWTRSSNEWMAGRTPYNDVEFFPPLAYVLAAPLAVLQRPTAYRVMTALTVLAFAWITVVLPLATRQGRGFSAVQALVVATGFCSYGLQFELERGQFGLVTIALALTAVWLFHYRPRLRWLAYAVFIIAVHLKVYPLIFGLMLVDERDNLRSILRRALWLGAANEAALMVLGPSEVANFIRALGRIILRASGHPANLSVRSYASTLPNPQLLELGLMVLLAVGLGFVIFTAVRRGTRGMNPAVLMACAVVAMTVPQLSYDYKLSWMVGPTAMLLMDYDDRWRGGENLDRVTLGMIFLLSLAYAITLFPYEWRPAPIQNSFPLLAAMLLLTASIERRLTAPASVPQRLVQSTAGPNP